MIEVSTNKIKIDGNKAVILTEFQMLVRGLIEEEFITREELEEAIENSFKTTEQLARELKNLEKTREQEMSEIVEKVANQLEKIIKKLEEEQ